MATITLTVVAGAQTYTKTKTISGPDLVRLLAATRLRFGMLPAATDTEVADKFFDELYRLIQRQIQDTEQQSVAVITLT